MPCGLANTSSTFLLCARQNLPPALHKIHRGWERERCMAWEVRSQGLVLFMFCFSSVISVFIGLPDSRSEIRCPACRTDGRERPSVHSGAVCVELAADSFTHMTSKTAMERACLADEWMKREVKLRSRTIFAWTEGCSLRLRRPVL
jgi:hypothetical protein